MAKVLTKPQAAPPPAAEVYKAGGKAASLAKGAVPLAPPAGVSGVRKSATLQPAAKPAAATTAAAAAQGAERAPDKLKHVYFDVDQTISKIHVIHVFEQLTGWEAGVDASHALFEGL